MTTSARPSIWRRVLQPVVKAPQSSQFWLTLVYFACGLTVAGNFVRVHRVTGRSMTPTLSPHAHETGQHDWVLFKRWLNISRTPAKEGGNDRPGELERGMIVSFWTPHNPEKVAVKRIIALPGDVVRPLSRTNRTGRHISPSDSTYLSGHPRDSVVVPYGHVWVEGDNSDHSRDSNDYGPISKSLIIGVGSTIVWPSPFSRWGSVEDWRRPDWMARYKNRVLWRVSEEDDVPEEWEMQKM